MNRRLLPEQRQQPPVRAAEYAGSRPAGADEDDPRRHPQPRLRHHLLASA